MGRHFQTPVLNRFSAQSRVGNRASSGPDEISPCCRLALSVSRRFRSLLSIQSRIPALVVQCVRGAAPRNRFTAPRCRASLWSSHRGANGMPIHFGLLAMSGIDHNDPKPSKTRYEFQIGTTSAHPPTARWRGVLATPDRPFLRPRFLRDGHRTYTAGCRLRPISRNSRCER